MPNASKKDDNTTGKKQAHEIRGVLLTIMCFCLLSVNKTQLTKKIGEEPLAKIIHVFEQTILLKCLLEEADLL